MREALADVVVQLSRHAAALDFLRLDQAAIHARQRFLNALLLGQACFHRGLLANEFLALSDRTLALDNHRGERDPRHRQHHEQHVEQRGIDERGALGKRALPECSQQGRQHGNHQHRERRTANAEVDGRPHHERQHGERQHVGTNREQVAEDQEAGRDQQCQQNDEFTDQAIRLQSP